MRDRLLGFDEKLQIGGKITNWKKKGWQLRIFLIKKKQDRYKSVVASGLQI